MNIKWLCFTCIWIYSLKAQHGGKVSSLSVEDPSIIWLQNPDDLRFPLSDTPILRWNSSQVLFNELQTSAAQTKEADEEQAAGDCDLGGRRLRVAVSPQPPFVNCLQDLYGEWLCNGSNIEVLSLLERRLNFQAELVVLAAAGGGSSGGLGLGQRSQAAHKVQDHSGNNNNNYTGVLGMVASGRAWLSVNGLMQTPERKRGRLLFSEPFDNFRIHFLLSKSVRDHDHIFIKPFSARAWLAILCSALAVVPAFYLLNTTSAYYALQDDRFLRRIPVAGSVLYLLQRAGKAIGCGGASRCRRRRAAGERRNSSRSSSSASTFDEELDKMVTTARETPAMELRRERMARRRVLRRQWAAARRRARRAGRRARKSGFFRAAYVLWYVVGSLAFQGGETEDLPRAYSTRVLVAFWWLYLIVVNSIHSGILTAILTFPKQNDFIQTLDDFLATNDDSNAQSRMKLAVDKHSELANLLSSPDNLHLSPLQQLFGARQHSGQTDHSAAASGYQVAQVDFQRHRQRVLDEIQRGHSALLEEKSAADLIISQEYFDQRPPRCQFKSSRHAVDVVPMSLVLSRQFPDSCLAAINKLLGRILRTGLAQKWRRKYEAQGNDCLNSVVINAGDVDKIELRHVVLAFWLLGAGLLVGALLLILEVVWLFTADDDDDLTSSDLSSSSSSSNSLTDSSDDEDLTSAASNDSNLAAATRPAARRLPKLGARLALEHRATVCGTVRRPLKSLRGRPFRMPRRLAASSGAGGASESSPGGGGQSQDSKASRKRQGQRRAAAAERRARRLRRTLEMIRRLQEGKIYSDFFLRVSGNVQSRARRASHAIVSRLAVPGVDPSRGAGSSRHKSTASTATQEEQQMDPQVVVAPPPINGRQLGAIGARKRKSSSLLLLSNSSNNKVAPSGM